MASKLIPTSLLILILISLLFIRESYGVDANEIGHRKMLTVLKSEKTILEVSHQVSSSIIKNGSKIFRELKKAPSCPNPLHNC
ncbi:hypothetical protein P8452_53322 [Trifolium repens]|nr:hypothetical protein P8452_53322 [Trifolium repens]